MKPGSWVGEVSGRRDSKMKLGPGPGRQDPKAPAWKGDNPIQGTFLRAMTSMPLGRLPGHYYYVKNG